MFDADFVVARSDNQCADNSKEFLTRRPCSEAKYPR